MKLKKWTEVLLNYFSAVAIASHKDLVDVAKEVNVAIRDGKILFVYGDGREDLISLDRECSFRDLSAIRKSIEAIIQIVPGGKDETED